MYQLKNPLSAQAVGLLLDHSIWCHNNRYCMRKDLIPVIGATVWVLTNLQKKIKGSVHAERILIKTKNGWELLLKYSGYTKDRKCIALPQKLSTKEFCQLCQTLRSDGLAQLIERILFNG